MKVPQADLWKYEGCEFVAMVAGIKMRIILKGVDSKNVHVANYYHRSNTYKLKLNSFLKQFELVI